MYPPYSRKGERMPKRIIPQDEMLDKHFSLRFTMDDWHEICALAKLDQIPPSIWMRIKIKNMLVNLRKKQCKK